MANYDISEAFEVIEDELISSMMRNLSRHRIDEVSQGMEWEQWQVLQLQALEEYRQRNQKKFPPRFNKLNGQIANALHTSYQSGATSQERQILQAIQNGYKPPVSAFSGQTEITGEFFKTNDRKLNALVNATVSDMSKAEYSILRHTDDQYRQIIFNAQVYANTGAGTYEKAVDMATKDFLKAGINSITYKNGSRHTIEEYSRMALQTAMKRAYLQGEGEKRKEFGIPTVILKKRTCACLKCLPFVGKVFIDDVWSGGDSSGISPITGIKYPLLSQAIALGLYHPNCRDTHSTYYEGISTPPEDSTYTAEELETISEKYKAEQQQSYCDNQADRYHRLSKYSLDSDNKRMYGARAKAWDNKAEQYRSTVSEMERVAEQSKLSVDNPQSVVNNSMLKSADYRRLYDKLGENSKITRRIFQQAKSILQHRSGSNFEDLMFIDSVTGKSLTRTDYNKERQCVPSKAMKRMVYSTQPYTIIGLHNHPSSTVPSLDDIKMVFERKQKYGIIACHNGNVYKYRVLGEYNDEEVDFLLDRLNRAIYNDNRTNEKILSVINELKENNVEMEVFLWQ